MRRLSMTALRSTARHVLRGLAIVGPACIHQRNAREAARRARPTMTQAQCPNPYLPPTCTLPLSGAAFGADRGAPWCDPTNGG